MYTLGINAAFHDSAACLVRDGQVLSAAEEERFSRIKHAKRPIPFSAYELPYAAISYCLSSQGISLGDVDRVAYSFDPRLLPHDGSSRVTLPLEPSTAPIPAGYYSPWEPLFLASVMNAPRQLESGAPYNLKHCFEGPSRYEWRFVEHHIAHAASAFLASPFERAAVMTLDGRGERATTSYWYADEAGMQPLGQVDLPHSLGLLYEKITSFLGFLHSSDEYKVMALASFGVPRYAPLLRDAILLMPDGQYRIEMPEPQELFGAPRRREEPLETRHFDIAASLQLVLEEKVLELSKWLHEKSRSTDLCLAGGVALNCVLTGKLRKLSPFKRIWVQPAANDAGTALGAALWVDRAERPGGGHFTMRHAYWGPDYRAEQIEKVLTAAKVEYERPQNLWEETAELLAADLIAGWFQGGMEFGPRALGARSILASPCSEDMRRRLNDLKGRENFRPVAPVVIEEKASEWFQDAAPSPFMTFVFNVIPAQACRIPAALHVDGSARVQTVAESENRRLYALLKAFERGTGIPVLINTSFNTRGRPIVCTPRDALEAFFTSPLDALIIGPFLLRKAASSIRASRTGAAKNLLG